MGDLISRQSAYDTLTEYYHHTTQTQHDALRDALSRVPSAQPEVLACGEGELNAQGWVPWWQEYPDDNRFVLVCNDDGRMAIAQYIGHEVDAYHPWQIAYCPYDVDVWEEDEYGKIIAWMPLPEPWKGEPND